MKKKILIPIIIVLILLVVIGAYVYINSGLISEKLESKVLKENLEIEQPKIKTFTGDDRPIAVMIDNNTKAWPQASVNKAYIIYEIIVEGGETRLMALFKGSDADSIGPIRSSRHYFLDYALENDAIYAHLGWSPQAQSDISSLKVNNINGQAYDTGKARTDTSLFWRSKKAKPHNAYTNIESLLEISKKLKYRTTSSKESVLNYSIKNIEFDDFEDNEIIANSVTIPYQGANKIKYVYNEETGKYEKYSKGKKQTDEATGEAFAAKNIIITFASNYTLKDTENKGRQGLNNIGNLNGYYLTNGKAIKITCKKASRTAQTDYLDENGNEIQVNDGNTFINICPINSKVTFE